MITVANVANVLGLPPTRLPQSTMGLVTQIEEGLPIGVVDRVARLVAPLDTQFKYKLVPRATLERRKASNTLSPEEGTRLARLARVWGLALDVWKEEEDARDFLFRAHPMMGPLQNVSDQIFCQRVDVFPRPPVL